MIEIGAKAPAIALKDQNGKLRRLSEFKGQNIVLYFYPRDNTSGCTKQACAFRDEIESFGELNAVVIGVSPDDETSHTKFITKYELPFILLADPERKALEKYGVWQEKNMYGRKVMGVVRTTYIIDSSGKIAARFDKVRVADHIPKVIETLQSLTD
ncbi:thioredoxin-dependent thiol peroxidase [Poriferisphaera corsica]|uniref:thioredoxin-dependent thiol peroxidase n=1 Tax=Poriferisphaera corsica TaxID=2528020 RepID=UPI0011A0FD29